MFDPKLKEALSRVQKPGRYTGGEPGSVSRRLGQRHLHQIPGLSEGGHGVEQGGAGLGLARPGIDNEQQCLIHEQSPFSPSPRQRGSA